MRAHHKRKKMLFLLSVDTEEEFDWNGDFPQADCAVENIKCLPSLHSLCVETGIRPTYLVDYPVAATPETAAILRELAANDQAEIGAHLHPWCTPPFVGNNTERESHVVNLSIDLVRQKLAALVRAIRENLGVNPTVFRTGRWGINGDVLRAIVDAGFEVDSSVYPYYENEFFSCMDAHSRPYWPDSDNPNHAGAQREIFEIPVTAGFNRPDFEFWGAVHRWLSHPWIQPLHPVGVAWRTGMLRKIYLSPELATADDMIDLVDAAIRNDLPVLHMFLHSSTLLPGHNEYTSDHSDRDDLLGSIRRVVAHVQESTDVDFCTLSEAAEHLKRMR